MAEFSCPKCDYDLTGHVGQPEIRCPECGEVSRASDLLDQQPRPPFRYAAIPIALLAGAALGWLNSTMPIRIGIPFTFTVWLPLTMGTAVLLGLLFPRGCWLWGPLLILGHLLVWYSRAGLGVPSRLTTGLTVSAMTWMLAIPFALLSIIGGQFGLRLRRRTSDESDRDMTKAPLTPSPRAPEQTPTRQS